MFNNYHSRNRSSRPTQRPLPEVADRQREESQCCDSEGLDDVAAFKVFLKRNMRHEAPPADLLGNIRARIKEIRAED